MKTKPEYQFIKCLGRSACLFITMLLVASSSNAQRSSLGVLFLEGKGVIPDAASLGGMARIEMEKTNVYNVLDYYDIRDVLTRNNLDLSSCFGKTCVVDAGKLLKADKMLLGSVERFDEKIVIILKIVDVKSGEIEKSNTTEYLNYQQDLQRMIQISVNRLVGKDVDPRLVESLVAFNEPVEGHVTKVNLSGPRFGLFYTSGKSGERMRADRGNHGGMGMYTVSTIIGWQQEIQYLSAGNMQCLFEFLFTGAGLESGRFIPAVTILNGFRMGKGGWELAFGPTFRVIRTADGYYQVHPTADGTYTFDPVTDWYLNDEDSGGPVELRNPVKGNLDERGDPTVTAGLLIGIGKTFNSGSLNIPVNAYCIPRKEGTVVGLSVGFNVFKSKKR